MPPSRRRALVAALIAAGTALASLVVLAPPASADAVDVTINEVRSDPTDTVELVNNGATTADVSGYVFKDNDDTHSYPLPGGTTIPAGGHLALDITAFGLGKGDSARLYLPDGTTLLDSTTWPANTHATTWGRCPDGTGEFGVMTESLGATNHCVTPDSAVTINEFSSNNPDFIELYNTGTGSVDLSGWMLKDSTDNNPYTFPAGSSIAAGEYQVLDGESVDFVFGLGNGDSVRLYSDADLVTPLDSHAYLAHPAAGKSYGRCPDATGPFEVTAAVTKGAANQCAIPAGGENIKVNEVQSDPGDLVELTNIGETTVDISGYVLKDNDDTHAFAIPASTTLAAGEYAVFDVSAAFGLGKGDSVRLYQPNLANVLDSTTYPADTHATTWGRCPDGTGDFGAMTDTLGTANACDQPNPAELVKVNEVESSGGTPGDWVELYNTSDTAIDISGWKVKDADDTHAFSVIPASTSIAAHGFYVVEEAALGFGLGSADSARLFLGDGATVVDSYEWAASASTTYGRCPDGTGSFKTTGSATKGAANDCPVIGLDAVKVNEVESSGGTPGDWVELYNTSEEAIDISGWKVKDADDTHAFSVIPASTSIAGHGFYVVEEAALGFGLGSADSARLFAPDGVTVADSHTWATAATTTYGRCPDGTGDVTTTVEPTKGAANACQPAGPPDVVVNEVESNGDLVADWVELKNRSGATVDVSGWKILDGDPSHAATPVVVPAGTTIPAGGYYAIYTEISQSPGFGLGVGDSVTLLLADGTTQVDTTTWGAHAATTWGRCPDGTGDFRETTTSTRGLANACSPVRINEVESSGGTPADWVELVNISASAVDVSGYVVKDGDDAHSYAIPASTSIAAKGYLVIDESALGFTLDDSDSVRLYAADGTTLIEQHTWATPATQSYARCKDGVGVFADSKAPTKGAVNSCPGLETMPWPGGQTVTTADRTETFLQDLSGLTFDPADPDVLWAAQNKKGTLFKLVRDADDNFVPATGWPKDPLYPDGTGAPDTEGITIGPDGFVYLASERNNAASGVSRMSILRYDPAAVGSTVAATDEWNLTGQIPAAGANLGLEGVAFVPDSFLASQGFKDESTGATYDPSTYPDHGSGLYVVAVEDTGDLIAFALDGDGTTSHKVATIDSGFAHLADVRFDPERQGLWAVTDDTHDGKSSVLKVGPSGAFVVDAAYDRPVGMPNLNNEGLAIAPRSTCVDGTKEVLWSDDGDTDGHSLRRGTISCTPRAAQTVTFTSAPPPSPVVGQTWAVTTSGGGSGNPVLLSVSGGCTLAGSTVTFAHAGTCTVTGQQAGNPSYQSGSVSREVTVAAATTTTTATIGADVQKATVAVVAPGAGSPSGSITFVSGGATLGTASLVGGVATLAKALPAGADDLTVSYAGSADFTASSGSATRTDPTITAELSSTRPASGWWTGPVTVTFSCTPASAPLVGGCPVPVTLTGDGADRTVSGSVQAQDGGAASVTVEDIDIDGAKPSVRVAGVRDGATYRGSAPKPVCQASDDLSGLDTCTLEKKASKIKAGKKFVVTARAVDVAGNEATTKVTYKVLKKN